MSKNNEASLESTSAAIDGVFVRADFHPDGTLTNLSIYGEPDHCEWTESDGDVGRRSGPASELFRQLREYFDGARTEFDLSWSTRGTEFQESVWRELESISFGETRSYGDIAAAVGRPGGARAVGNAVGANPLPILVPCHRVIRSDGSIGGYSGGIHVKKRLLSLEGVTTAG